MILRAVPNRERNTFDSFLLQYVQIGSTLATDSAGCYDGINAFFGFGYMPVTSATAPIIPFLVYLLERVRKAGGCSSNISRIVAIVIDGYNSTVHFLTALCSVTFSSISSDDLHNWLFFDILYRVHILLRLY